MDPATGFFIRGNLDFGYLYGNVFTNLWKYRRYDDMKKKLHEGFTLIEMMIVLLIVSILVMLFIPNLMQGKETVRKQGDSAVVKSVETQIDLFELENNRKMTEEDMTREIPAEQLKIYRAAQP
jgi:competence protein ComGC